MALPTKCEMPDLSKLNRLVPRMLVLVLVGESGLSSEQRLYRRDLVRLLDKTVFEYSAARKALRSQIGSQTIHMLRFCDHLENCINAMHRCVCRLERLRRSLPTVQISRALRRSLEAAVQNLGPVRNTIEHMDEAIARGELSIGKPVMLALETDEKGVRIGEAVLRFSDLANAIRHTHEIVTQLLTVQ